MSQFPQIQYQRPTKQDILVVSTTALMSISLLSLALHTICVHLHTQPLVWLVLLIVLWFPTIAMLSIFPPESLASKDASLRGRARQSDGTPSFQATSVRVEPVE